MNDIQSAIDKRQKIKILIIDDNEMFRVYIRDIFWIHGLDKKYDIMMADSPERAEAILNNPATRPHIVLLDLLMPTKKEGGGVINTVKVGIELLKKIKSSPGLKHIKVVIFSGHDELQEVVEKLGADGCLFKGDNLPKDVLNYVQSITKAVKAS